MTLYEINEALLNLIDPETGEIADYEAFDQLQMDRQDKLENLACWIKDMKAEEAALKAEKDNLAKREEEVRKKRERITEYLGLMLNGQKLNTARVAVSFRKNPPSTHIADEDRLIAWAKENDRLDLIKVTEAVNRAGLKDELKRGAEIPGAWLESSVGMVIR